MPLKSSLHMRTWGTRFDTLPTSPSVSPPAREAIPTQGTSPEAAIDSTLLKNKEEKMPHDASVFVGSLPSTLDQTELTRLLSEHLSEHTQVKNIKVVRDSKGGVCAFVQCEDAASAATLIHTLHSNPPKYFLGRMLRYEPARAFRTLLISYRTPMQYIPASKADNHLAAEAHPIQRGQTIELNLPYAMRLWRPRNSKFFSLSYNAEAVDAENYSTTQPPTSENPSLFLQPVAFDAKTIYNLAAYFGRLERFNPYDLSSKLDQSQKKDALGENWKHYPAPHNAPRSLGMDTTCWEVKWNHRDDCINALMTLRRVPHLTATWAHQPSPYGFEQRPPHPGSLFPYPLHVQDYPQTIRSNTTPFSISSHATDLDKRSYPNTNEASSDIGGLRTNDDIRSKMAQPVSCHDSPRSAKDFALSEEKDDPSEVHLKWSDTDFPPLSDAGGERKADYGVWVEKKLYKNEAHEPSPETLPLESEFLTTPSETSKGADEEQEIDVPPTPGLSKSPITPRTPGTLFPVTPITANSDLQGPAFRGYEGKDNYYYNESNPTEREVDPTTLFVGGLETFGPGAWDEEKVTKFFSRFGGLESVKVVRPLNSHSSFAFVKFNNTESPARAILEEHNRVYEGRAMRVQLRDCNPPRGSWRHNRGRGRFYQSHFGSHRRLPEHFEESFKNLNVHSGHDQGAPVSNAVTSFISASDCGTRETEPTLSSHSEANIPAQVDAEPSGDVQDCNPSTESSRPSTPEPLAANLNMPSQPTNYHEWYDAITPAERTPPPPSFGSSTSAPIPASALPYSVSTGYYAPPPWIHPYAQYQMPYFGYPGYTVPSQPVPVPVPTTFATPPRSESTGSTAPIQTHWPSMAMYGSYIPYQTSRTPTVEQSQPQHLNNRAPVVPTGFIQNEQGTLVAVYQPEAIDQYMAGSHTRPPVHPPIHTIPSWPQYPQPGYPFPVPPSAVVLPSRPALSSTTHMGWPPSQVYGPQAPPPTPQASNTQNPGPTYHGGYGDTDKYSGPPSFRRQPGRRDQHTYNRGRNDQYRPLANRGARGNASNANHAGGEGHFRPTQSNQHSGEWNQWGPGDH